MDVQTRFGTGEEDLTPAQRVGLDGERAVIDDDPRLGVIPEETTWKADAVVLTDCQLGSRGTPVEVKVCVRWKAYSNGRRAGEWVIREAQHDWLTAHDGVYILSIYTGGEDEREWLATVTLTAEGLDACIKTWWDYSIHTRATNVPWTRLLSRRAVLPPDYGGNDGD